MKQVKIMKRNLCACYLSIAINSTRYECVELCNVNSSPQRLTSVLWISLTLLKHYKPYCCCYCLLLLTGLCLVFVSVC